MLHQNDKSLTAEGHLVDGVCGMQKRVTTSPVDIVQAFAQTFPLIRVCNPLYLEYAPKAHHACKPRHSLLMLCILCSEFLPAWPPVCAR